MLSTLRSSVTSLVYHGSRWAGLQDRGVRILCYHRVNDERQNYLTVSTPNFRAQMQFLKEEGYKTIDLNELIDLEGQEEAPEKLIAITFDDGWRDNFTNAFPILKSFQFSATVFLITGEMGKDSFLNYADIREMRAAGITFGSHTESHAQLPQLDRKTKWKEILGSKKSLERVLEESVDFFCYPKGLYDRETVDLVREAGYVAACSNRPGGNKQINPYLLKRTEISGFDSLAEFRKKIAGAYDLLHRGLHFLRGRP